ncbi:hypothetical protein AVEN_29633-1 [Araneus ventricosus]|uniref:Uncharacterized protein n=1 Tax=Araneus ventricosus TaxID=182803 RepID=A0A4Y2N8F3_ARAVE|nr:hypothetical protein AVEN_29633-1 [Araneus ventricosus]
MVSVTALEPGGREFYPGLCFVFCNKFARQACGKFAASSFHGDFGAFVNLLQACTLVMINLWQTCTLVMTNLWQTCTLVMTNLWQACCKLKLLSGLWFPGSKPIPLKIRRALGLLHFKSYVGG